MRGLEIVEAGRSSLRLLQGARSSGSGNEFVLREFRFSATWGREVELTKRIRLPCRFDPAEHIAWGATIGLSWSLIFLIALDRAIGASVGADFTRYYVALTITAPISCVVTLGFTLAGFLISVCGNGAVACRVSSQTRRHMMATSKQDDAKILNRELKDTFPASDPPSSTQPEKRAAGAPADRTSVNSGAERKLAEELELNDTKKNKP